MLIVQQLRLQPLNLDHSHLLCRGNGGELRLHLRQRGVDVDLRGEAIEVCCVTEHIRCNVDIAVGILLLLSVGGLTRPHSRFSLILISFV